MQNYVNSWITLQKLLNIFFKKRFVCDINHLIFVSVSLPDISLQKWKPPDFYT